jgi:hypothetical protein
MPQSPEQQAKLAELVRTLIEQKLISAPQAEIAKADAEVTGMGVDEVLMARRWVNEDVLKKLAPWLSEVEPQPSAPEATENQPDPSELQSSDNFDDNLQKYRALMDRILGEANK